MKKINKSKSGAIICKPGITKKILLLYRGNHNDWSFPKGHAEAGEDAQSTMIREIEEETSLKVKIIKELPELRYSKKSETVEENIVCYMYLVEPTSQVLKNEHEFDKLEWVDIDKVTSVLTYQNLKDYFESIRSFI